MVSNRTSFVLLNVCALMTGVTVVAAFYQRLTGKYANLDFGKPPAGAERLQELKKQRAEREQHMREENLMKKD